MRTPAIAALALSLALSSLAVFGPVHAQDDPRFQIERVGEDVLRLDRETGEVQLCARAQPTYACRTVVEATSREATAAPASGEILEENNALRAENRALKEKLSMIAAIVEGADTATEAGGLRSTEFASDARRDIDQAVEVTDYAVRRFRDLLKSFDADPAN